MNLEEKIRTTIITHCEKTDDVDRYGQLTRSGFSLSNLFNENEVGEIEEFVKSGKSKLVCLSHYGNGHFTYYALDVISDTLRKEMSEATKKNATVDRCLNRW